MKLSSLFVLIALIACVALASQKSKYQQCLFSCKLGMAKDRVPTSCFDQCKSMLPGVTRGATNNGTATVKPLKCRIPILKLQCKQNERMKMERKQSNATAASTMSDADQFDLPVNADSLWAAYHTELLRFLTKGNAAAMDNFAGLQLVSTPFPAEWDTNAQAFQVMASRVSKFQKIYEPTFSNWNDNYCEDFVPNLYFPPNANPAAEAEIKTLYANQDALTQKILVEESKCEDRFYALSPSLQARYAGFDDYAKRSCSNLSFLMQQASVLNGQIQYLYNSFAGGRKEMEARTSLLKCRNTVRNYFELNPLSDFMRNVNAGRMNPFSIELSQMSTTSQAKSSFSSAGFSLVVINFSMNRAMRSLTTSMRDFRLKISAKSYGAISMYNCSVL